MDDGTRDTPGLTGISGITGISALADPVRRRVYRWVSDQREPVGRDQAAAALGLPRHQVAFHLDRLERAGLLSSDYVRLTGRVGPGAGRPAKVYRRCPGEIAVSLPERHYDLAGEIMAAALADALEGAAPLADVLVRAATGRGEELAASVAVAETPLATAVGAVQALGYEPRVEGDQVVMANCPFHALAQRHPALVCGVNLALLQGLCRRLGGLEAVLSPEAERCCVLIRQDPS